MNRRLLFIGSLRKYINYIIGALLMLSGFVLKTLFNHNYEWWGIVKGTTIILFAFGFLFFFNRFFSSIGDSPKKLSSKNVSIWLLYIANYMFFYIFAVFFIIMCEGAGKASNYKLRNYFLSKETVVTTAIISDIKSVDLISNGEETFYILMFPFNDNLLKKGLIVEYSIDDGVTPKQFNIPKGKSLLLEKMIGRKVEVAFSKKYPSFLRINKF